MIELVKGTKKEYIYRERERLSQYFVRDNYTKLT
jgi:hypothetical protein